MPISTLKKALKNLNGRRKKVLLKILALPTEGRDSHNYTRYHDKGHVDYDSLTLPDTQTLWQHNEDHWQQNVDGSKRWRTRDES